MILAYKKKSNSAAAVMLAAFLGAWVCNTLNDPQELALQWMVALLASMAGIAFWYSCWFYIKAKGRSGWWVLVMVFNIVGLIVLASLQDRAIEHQTEAGKTSIGSRRKWSGIVVIDKLNGWQRLWVLLTILWLIPVGFLMYPRWPSPDSARVAGCIFPSELFSLAASEIVNDELINWRHELPPNLVLNPDDQLILRPGSTRPQFLTEYEMTGIMRWFPEWKGDPLGRPEWAKAPWVKTYCKTLIERLERSGRTAQLRNASASAMQKPRIEWFVVALAAWICPAVVLYLLGLAMAWVARGFRKEL